MGIASTVNIIGGLAKKQGRGAGDRPGPLPLVTCYPGKINQVVMNLLTNAIDACAAGGQVTVRTRARRPTAWRSTCPTPAAGSPRRSATGSSTRSSPPSRSARGPGSACRSATGSSGARRDDRSGFGARPGGALHRPPAATTSSSRRILPIRRRRGAPGLSTRTRDHPEGPLFGLPIAADTVRRISSRQQADRMLLTGPGLPEQLRRRRVAAELPVPRFATELAKEHPGRVDRARAAPGKARSQTPSPRADHNRRRTPASQASEVSQ